MFGFITDSIENTMDVAETLLGGELPTKRQVAALVADGLSAAIIAEAGGVAVDVIEGMIE